MEIYEHFPVLNQLLPCIFLLLSVSVDEQMKLQLIPIESTEVEEIFFNYLNLLMIDDSSVGLCGGVEGGRDGIGEE